MMLLHVCVTRNWVMSVFTISLITSYKGNFGKPFEAEQQPVLLIDEIDKADIEFPNDLLLELDRMEFYVYETKKIS